MNNINGFYKVKEDGFSLTYATFFNPTTCEQFERRVWDNDDDRLLEDDELQALRYMPINKDALKAYNRFHGIISVGDTIEVYKGRKVPKGTVATVTAIKPYYDCYHRWCADYAYLDNGQRTNINNCRLV